MNIAQICKKVIYKETQSEDDIRFLEGLVSHCKQMDNWQDGYWLAKWASIYYNDTSSQDQFIINTLEDALNSGLVYSVDPDIFLDASMMLAKLYFKYKKYRRAENFLLLLRELPIDKEKIPNWVHRYSAITYFKLQLPTILKNPQDFFESVDIINETSETELKHKISLIKDFLNSVTIYIIDEIGINSIIIQNFMRECSQWIKPYILQVSDEWQDLVEACLDISDGKEDRQFLNYSLIIQLASLSVVVEMQKLKKQEGFPHVEEIRCQNGELKITKTSFRDALRRMLSYLDSISIDAV